MTGSGKILFTSGYSNFKIDDWSDSVRAGLFSDRFIGVWMVNIPNDTSGKPKTKPRPWP
jgi:hypothetical protein